MIVLTKSTKPAWFTFEVITIFSLCFSICLHRKKEVPHYDNEIWQTLRKNLWIISPSEQAWCFLTLFCNWWKGIGRRCVVQDIWCKVGVQNRKDSRILYQCNGVTLQHREKPSCQKQFNWWLTYFKDTNLSLTTVLVLSKC